MENQLAQLIPKIANEPNLFFENILGVELWEKEREIVESIRDNRRTTIRSCNSSGKTYTIARAALWFLYAYAPAVVINTAPTFKQVRNQFWRELHTAYNYAKVPLGGKLKQTELEFAANWYALGIATRDGEGGMESIQGFHADNILFILDEASGISHGVFEAIEGGLTGGGMVRNVLIGNPTRNSGEFADSFKSSIYNKIRISAFDTPNLKEGKTVIKGLVTKEWVEEMQEKYGEDSDVYRVRVLGEFPKDEADVLIALSQVEAAIDAERELVRDENGNDEFIGLDPARKGQDKAAFVYRKGNFAKVLETVDKSDTMILAGKAISYMNEYPDAILRIDIIGLGAGIFDRLREQPAYSGRVEGVNVAVPPVTLKAKAKYVNRRIEGWDLVKQWLKSAVLEKHEGWYQLAVPKYALKSNGQMILESKEDLGKRGVKSPDVADALALTFQKPTEGGIITPQFI